MQKKRGLLNKNEVGDAIEKIGIVLLQNEGYKILEWTSQRKPQSPYDILVQKGETKFFVEVRGRTEEGGYFVFTTNKMNRLEELGKNVLVMLIKPNGYKLLTLDEMKDDDYVAITDVKNRPRVPHHSLDKFVRISAPVRLRLMRLKEFHGKSSVDAVMRDVLDVYEKKPKLRVTIGTVDVFCRGI